MSKPTLHGLHRISLCRDGREFLKSQGSLQAAWDNCEKYFWLCHYLRFCGPKHREFTERISNFDNYMYRHQAMHDRVQRGQLLCDFIRIVYPTPPRLAAKYRRKS